MIFRSLLTSADNLNFLMILPTLLGSLETKPCRNYLLKVVQMCNFNSLNTIHQLEFVEVGGDVLVTANYPKGGDADIRYFRSKYCYIATDVKVMNITRSYRSVSMLPLGECAEFLWPALCSSVPFRTIIWNT